MRKLYTCAPSLSIVSGVPRKEKAYGSHGHKRGGLGPQSPRSPSPSSAGEHRHASVSTRPTLWCVCWLGQGGRRTRSFLVISLMLYASWPANANWYPGWSWYFTRKRETDTLPLHRSRDLTCHLDKECLIKCMNASQTVSPC